MSKPRTAIGHMTYLVRYYNGRTQHEKQPGRRFGPAPKGIPAVESPGMGTERREDNYRAQTGRTPVPVARGYLGMATPQSYAYLRGLTPRQRRRSWKKELSNARRIGDRELGRKVDAALAEQEAAA